MDRIWQWASDRRGTRYSWVAYAIAILLSLPPFLFWSFLIVAAGERREVTVMFVAIRDFTPFAGDGALAVFGAPNELAAHADAALSAAVVINRLVAERFSGELRIGIGINTGTVIAGTIGGAGKLEFTLIGDTVNVAARVEQLTKTTGDTILMTQQSVDALDSRPSGLVDRGSHALKGMSAAVQVFALAPTLR